MTCNLGCDVYHCGLLIRRWDCGDEGAFRTGCISD